MFAIWGRILLHSPCLSRKSAYFIDEGDNLTMLLNGIRRFTKYDATGLLKSKRQLADAAIEAEKYIF